METYEIYNKYQELKYQEINKLRETLEKYGDVEFKRGDEVCVLYHDEIPCDIDIKTVKLVDDRILITARDNECGEIINVRCSDIGYSHILFIIDEIIRQAEEKWD